MFKKMFRKLMIPFGLVLTLNLAAITSAAPVQTTVEGEGTHFVTGKSYPSELIVSGYDSKKKTLYLNATFTSTDTVSTFNYYIYVFDDTGKSLGNAGAAPTAGDTSSTLQASTGGTPGTTANIKNQPVAVDPNELTAAYRIVVTVDSVVP